MPRKEQFAVGASLIAAGLAVILKNDYLAYFVLALGIAIFLDLYVPDWLWGGNRPTWEEVQKMSGEVYNEKVLRNSKTERWVNFLVSGRDVLKKNMRKLAREAVIFMLATPVLAFAGDFAVLYHSAHRQALSTTKDPYAEFGGWEAIPCKDGDSYIDQGRVVWTCQKGVRTETGNSIPGFWPDTSNIPPPPPGYVIVPPGAALIPAQSSSAVSTLDLLASALWLGLYGLPAGIGLWILYRAIRFAVRG